MSEEEIKKKIIERFEPRVCVFEEFEEAGEIVQYFGFEKGEIKIYIYHYPNETDSETTGSTAFKADKPFAEIMCGTLEYVLNKIEKTYFKQ